MGGVTRQDPEIGEIRGRVTTLEGQVSSMQVGQAGLASDLRAHTQRSDDRHEQVQQTLGELRTEIREQGSQTQSMVRDLIEQQRERDRREAEAVEREAEHRRTMERESRATQAAQAADRWATARAVVTHPAVVSLLTGLAGIAVALGWAISGGAVPGHTVTGQAAATGVMSAGVAD